MICDREGCKCQEFSGGEYPCCDCSRIEREDMYESEEEE